jgi:hypothetical protein
MKASIWAVVQEYQNLRNLSNTICKGNADCLERDKYRADVKQAYMRIIDTAYKNFNAMFQRDGFFTARLSAIVAYEYALRIRSGEDMGAYNNDLMRALGNTLLENVVNLNERQPSFTGLDLSYALTVSRDNLFSFEQIFRDTFSASIAELDVLEKGNSSTNYDLWKRTQVRRMLDANNLAKKMNVKSGFTLGTAFPMFEAPLTLFNYFMYGVLHPERYPNYSWDDQIPRRQDDAFKTIAFSKARLCTQTLAFQDMSLYQRFCKGAVLEGFYGGNHDPLKAKNGFSEYDTHYDKYLTADRYKNGADDTSICALRDNGRRNYIKWLSDRSKVLKEVQK